MVRWSWHSRDPFGVSKTKRSQVKGQALELLRCDETLNSAVLQRKLCSEMGEGRNDKGDNVDVLAVHAVVEGFEEETCVERFLHSIARRDVGLGSQKVADSQVD